MEALFFPLYAQEAVVAADKMNVFYVGIDNPISIAVPNTSNDNLLVTIDNQATIQKMSDGKYIVRVIRTGQVNITIEANGKTTTKQFRVKAIPDPVVRIGNQKGGIISIEQMKSIEGIVARIENFDINAGCSIQSYTIVLQPKNNEVYQINVSGPLFPKEFKDRFKTLKANDVVNFLEIKVRCPGDNTSRNLGSLSFIFKY